MIAEIGHALLWLATGCAGLAAVAGFVRRLRGLAVPAALAAAWLWLWVGGALAWVFAQADMSVAAVAANTHAALPGALRLAAVVLRDGGGVAVAASLAAALGGVLAFAGARATLVGAASLIVVALHVLLLVVADPFARLVPAPTDGAGFDPAWRDRLAAFAPFGAVVVDAPLALGAELKTGGAVVRLAALIPVAGPDSTAVLAEISIDDRGNRVAILAPAWRETNLPPHGAPVADTALNARGWWSATLGAPRADGRWRVRVTRLPLVALALPVLLVGGTAAMLVSARRRGRR